MSLVWRFVLAAAIAASIILGAALVLTLRDRDEAVAAYSSRLRALEAENQTLAGQLEELLGEVRGLNQRIEASYAPIEVGGRLNLPIHRAFARPRDTLDRFAVREKVAPEVLRALNPWLPEGAPEDVPLQDRQSLWVPKPE